MKSKKRNLNGMNKVVASPVPSDLTLAVAALSVGKPLPPQKKYSNEEISKSIDAVLLKVTSIIIKTPSSPDSDQNIPLRQESVASPLQKSSPIDTTDSILDPDLFERIAEINAICIESKPWIFDISIKIVSFDQYATMIHPTATQKYRNFCNHYGQYLVPESISFINACCTGLEARYSHETNGGRPSHSPKSPPTPY